MEFFNSAIDVLQTLVIALGAGLGIGYNFLIGDTKKYKAFPWLAISNMDEQKLTVCEELMKMQIAFFEELGMQKIADHCVRIMEDYRKGIGKRKESDCR